MTLPIPRDMNRRHFFRHLATSAATLPTMQFLSHLQAHAEDVRKNQKSCILMWMGGGPPTIDIWDLKPGSKNGGEFRPIATKAPGIEICEHMAQTAQVMDELALVRAMSTREADHGRGRYYMHTAYVPNPTVVHPTFGSVVSYELGPQRSHLEIPAFISIGGGSGSPGYLGMAHAPFRVDSNGRIRNAQMEGVDQGRLGQRLAMLKVIETNFIESNRGEAPKSHKDVYKKAVDLMTSEQRRAFKVGEEPPKVREAYGETNFGRGLLMARRLVELGVPFVEVNLGGWDTHSNNFETLRQKLPTMDQAIASLVADLRERGLLEHTVLVWMGEFGRTPRINQNVGRDHYASAWTVMLGGGGLNGGVAVGETDKDGKEVASDKTYLPGDIWATVAQALGIPLDTVHTSKRGRPMKIANGGTPVQELVG